MQCKKIAALFTGVFLASGFAFAQPAQTPEPILFQDFETSIGQWITTGGADKVELTRDAENVKSGQSALRFNYTVQTGEFQALAIPQAAGKLAALQSIKFWVKCDHSTTLLLAAQEEGGGYFGTAFSVAKDKWQYVEANLDDFLLQDAPGDPKDANGKLDRDKISAIGLLDYDQVLLKMLSNAPAEVAQMLPIASGPRTLYLDDVTFSSQPLPKSEETPDEANIDSFQRPQVEWASIGGATLERLQAKDPKDNALKVTYPQQPGRLMALVKPLRRGVLAGKKQLSFRAASMKPTTFWLQLEEVGGGKYNTSFTVPGNAVPTPITVNFANFKTSPDSNDNNNRLDLEQVKQLLIVDVSGMAGAMPGGMPPEIPGAEMQNENTLWLNAMHAK